MSNTEKPAQSQPSQPTAEELAKIRDDFHAFIGGFKSLTMATVNANGEPESSYAPFIQQDGYFYVFLSELASHTQNLLSSKDGEANVSLFWIEPEDQARNIFARTRATVFASAEVIDRASDDGQAVLDAMEEQLGNTMQVLRGLGDFHLFRLTSKHGAYVTGFAKAFRLEGEGLEQVVHQGR